MLLNAAFKCGSGPSCKKLLVMTFWRAFFSWKKRKIVLKVRNNGACAIYSTKLNYVAIKPISLHFFCFYLNFFPFWIRIRILNADPDPGGKMNADLDPQFRHCRSNGTWSKMLRDRKCETGQMRREMEKRRRETVDYRLEDRRQKTGDGWQEKGNLSPVKWERGSNRCEGEKNWVFWAGRRRQCDQRQI